jgi:hypothetical protein
VLLLAAFAGHGRAGAADRRERDRANREAEAARRVPASWCGCSRCRPSEARGNSITAREILDTGAARIAQELAGQPEVQGRLMNTMGTVYQSLGLYQESAALYRQSLDVRRRALGNRDPAVALHDLGTLLVQSGDHARQGRQSLALRECCAAGTVYAPDGRQPGPAVLRARAVQRPPLFSGAPLRRLAPARATSDALNDL